MPDTASRKDAKTVLSREQIERYHREGYIIPDFRLPDAVLERMQEALNALMTANPHLATDNMFCPHLTEAGVQGLKGDPVWLEFAAYPDILDFVEQLIGPDFLLWGSTVFGKPAFSGKEVPMHQDGEYWPIRPLATCSAWIALDDTTLENGCLHVIPGSHREQRLLSHHQDDGDHLALNQALDRSEYREEDAVPILLKAGQVSFHDVYLAHGSQPNRSPNRRAGFVCRYMPTSSHFDHAYGAELQKKSGTVDFSGRRVIQMRGGDLCGRNNFSIGT